MLFIVSLLVEVSHGPFRSCCHQALIYSGVIVTVVQKEKPSNPTLPVFAFFGQEAVWALRSKTCSHPLIKVWGGEAGLLDKDTQLLKVKETFLFQHVATKEGREFMCDYNFKLTAVFGPSES